MRNIEKPTKERTVHFIGSYNDHELEEDVDCGLMNLGQFYNSHYKTRPKSLSLFQSTVGTSKLVAKVVGLNYVGDTDVFKHLTTEPGIMAQAYSSSCLGG